MILLIDIGNTRLKWAIYENKKLSFGTAVPHSNESLEDLCDKLWQNLDRPTRIMAANVAGRIMELQLSAWVRAKWQQDVHFCTVPQTMLGLTNGYQDHSKFGVDRWLAMLWAWSENQGPCCVIDCGTAVTVDAIDKSGKHLGGLIIPGLDLMQESLLKNTKGINLTANKVQQKSLLATDTYHGVMGGTLYSLGAFVNQLMNDFANDEDGDNLEYKFFLTGGGAQQLLPLLGGQLNYHPNMVLMGMKLLVENGC